MRYAIAIPDTWYAICNIGANGIFLVSLSWYWDQSDLYKIRQPSLFWVQLARTPSANWSEKPIQRCSSKYKVWIMHQNLPAHLFKPARTAWNTFARSSGRGRQKSGSTVQLYKSSQNHCQPMRPHMFWKLMSSTKWWQGRRHAQRQRHRQWQRWNDKKTQQVPYF